MTFLSSARFRFNNDRPISLNQVTTLTNGDAFKLAHYNGDDRMVPKHSSGGTNQVESWAEDTYNTTELFSQAAAGREDIPPGFAIADNWLYYQDPGKTRSSGKSTYYDNGAAYAVKVRDGENQASAVFEYEHDTHVGQGTQYNGYVMAAGCGVVAVGSWDSGTQNITTGLDVLDRDGVSTTSKYIEIYSAGLKHKLFRIFPTDKRPYFGEEYGGINADDNTEIAGYETNTYINSVAIGDNRIVVGYANHDINGRDLTTGSYIPTGLNYTRPGYVEIYSLDGRLLNTLRPYERNTSSSTKFDDGLFGWDVAVGSGRIVIGSPGYDNGKGRVYVYDINGTYIRTHTGTQAETATDAGSCFGASVTVSGNLIIAGEPGYNVTSVTPNKGRWQFFNLWTGSMINSLYTGSANYDNLGHKDCIAVDGDILVFGDPDYSSGGYTSNGAVSIARINIEKNAGTEYLEFLDTITGTYNNQRIGSRVAINNGFIAYCGRRYDYDDNSAGDYWVINTRRLLLWFNPDDYIGSGSLPSGSSYTYSARHVAQTIGDYNPWKYLTEVKFFINAAGGGGGGGGGGNPNIDGGNPGGDGGITYVMNHFNRYSGGTDIGYISAAGGDGGGFSSIFTEATDGEDGVPYYDPDLGGGGAAAIASNYSGEDAIFGGGGGGGSNYGGYYGAGGEAGFSSRYFKKYVSGDTLSIMNGLKGSGGLGHSGYTGGDGSHGRVYLWTMVNSVHQDTISGATTDYHQMHLDKVTWSTSFDFSDPYTYTETGGLDAIEGQGYDLLVGAGEIISRALDRVVTHYNPYNRL